MSEKHCPQCDTTHPLVMFHGDASNEDGLYRICKRCRAKNRLRTELVDIHRDRANWHQSESKKWRARARAAEAKLAEIEATLTRAIAAW